MPRVHGLGHDCIATIKADSESLRKISGLTNAQPCNRSGNKSRRCNLRRVRFDETHGKLHGLPKKVLIFPMFIAFRQYPAGRLRRRYLSARRLGWRIRRNKRTRLQVRPCNFHGARRCPATYQSDLAVLLRYQTRHLPESG